MRRPRELFLRYWLPELVMLLLIKMESTDSMSGGHTITLLRAFFNLFHHHLSNGALEVVNFLVRKSGHAVGYALLTWCNFRLLRGVHWLSRDASPQPGETIAVPRLWWRPIWATIALGITFCVALADELHQMTIPSRTGNFHDVVLDTTAGAVLLLAVYVRNRQRCH